MSNGNIYDGDWMENERYGKGIYIYSDGCSYDGDWRYDRKHGKGKMIYSNGDQYDGNWKSKLMIRRQERKTAPGGICKY